MHGLTWRWNRRRRWQLQLLHPAGGYWFWREKKQWPRWFWPLFLASSYFLLFSFPPSLFCFLFLESWRWIDEDDRCWSFCVQPMVAASRDNESDGHAGFGLCSFSLLLLMLSLEMTKMTAMKACCAGGVVALASVFSLLLTVSLLWFSLPCLSLVSSSSLSLLFSDGLDSIPLQDQRKTPSLYSADLPRFCRSVLDKTNPPFFSSSASSLFATEFPVSSPPLLLFSSLFFLSPLGQ